MFSLCTILSNSGVPFSSTRPLPQSLTIRGGPSKALNSIVTRPLPGSRRCDMVLYKVSQLHNLLIKEAIADLIPTSCQIQEPKVLVSGTPKYWPPFGERLTCPFPDSGAVAIQKTFWANIQSMRLCLGISSKYAPIMNSGDDSALQYSVDRIYQWKGCQIFNRVSMKWWDQVYKKRFYL